MFKDNLVQMRKVLQLTQEDIAEKLGVTRQSVAKWEAGESIPDLDKCKQLADIFGVDVHLAHTYLMSNYENCQYHEECMTSYENIAVELMRALNFYRFSNPDSTLSDMWLCGGGAVIKPLRDTIVDMLDIELHRAEELVPEGNNVEECYSFVQAIGITRQESGKSGNSRRPGGRK